MRDMGAATAIANALRERTIALVTDPGLHAGPAVLVVDLGDIQGTCVVTPIVLSGRHEG